MVLFHILHQTKKILHLTWFIFPSSLQHLSQKRCFIKNIWYFRIFKFFVLITLNAVNVFIFTFLHLLVKHNAFEFSLYSAQLFQDIGEFEAKIYFTDHWTANTIQLFVPIKVNFSALFFFWTTSSEGGIPKTLLDICGHLFICNY